MAKWQGTNKPNSSRLVLCLSGVSDRIIQCFTYAQISPPEAATSVLPHGPRRVSASASALERKIKKICSSYVCGRVKASASLPRCVSCVILRMYVCMRSFVGRTERVCFVRITQVVSHCSPVTQTLRNRRREAREKENGGGVFCAASRCSSFSRVDIELEIRHNRLNLLHRMFIKRWWPSCIFLSFCPSVCSLSRLVHFQSLVCALNGMTSVLLRPLGPAGLTLGKTRCTLMISPPQNQSLLVQTTGSLPHQREREGEGGERRGGRGEEGEGRERGGSQ